MSRLRLAIRGMGSGYLLMVAAAIYGLGSIPVALLHLTKERFGLWALLVSLISYLNMIDLGMSSSVARHLIDAKDDREGGTYGSMIKTAWCVSLAQSVIVLLVGCLGAGMFSHLLGIPVHLERTFRIMIWLQCGVVALGFATKMFQYMLLAHQRLDLVDYSGVLSLGVNFAGMFIFFTLGADVYSLIYAGFAAFVASTLFQLAWCWKLSLFPQRTGWGRVSAAMFKEMFSYGRDVFLATLGNQMIMASQTIIITRQLGLEAAAAWTVGTRTFALVSQAISRVSYSALFALAEMVSRNEMDRLRARHPALMIFVTSLSVYCAVTFALCNSVFVSVWTSGKVSWSPVNDVWLGLWLVVLTVANTNGNLVLATKRIGAMKYAYLCGGIAFILLALVVTKPFGLPALIMVSVACTLFFSGTYNVWRISRFLGLPIRDMVLRWPRNAVMVLAAFAPVAVATWWSTREMDTRLRLVIVFAAGTVIGLPLFLRLGVPQQLKQELVTRAPKRFVPLVGMALGCSKAES